MPFVLDSSVALAWLLPDEASDAVDQLADRLEQDTASVPAIWALEVGNACSWLSGVDVSKTMSLRG